MKTASVVIRTKNEEKWIGKCLKAVFSQTFRDFAETSSHLTPLSVSQSSAFEVIVVDNGSVDKTLAIAKKFSVKIVVHKEKIWRPGKAINVGIKKSKGKYTALLSGHCVPLNNSWLSDLVSEIKKPKVAGVYGRQLPLANSSPLDKQDLLMFFGKDPLVQTKGHFFYFDNANSIIKRSVWEKMPFDEKVSHKENITWGRDVVQKGYRILYTPKAKVYHWHGINHAGNVKRAKEVVKVLEKL